MADTNIKTQIKRITENISSAYSAAAAKGASMPTKTDSDNLAATIQSIPAASEIDLSSYLPKSGGTMTGALVAQNNADYSVKQVRNVYIIADGDALPSGANGDICLAYTD